MGGSPEKKVGAGALSLKGPGANPGGGGDGGRQKEGGKHGMMEGKRVGNGNEEGRERERCVCIVLLDSVFSKDSQTVPCALFFFLCPRSPSRPCVSTSPSLFLSPVSPGFSLSISGWGSHLSLNEGVCGVREREEGVSLQATTCHAMHVRAPRATGRAGQNRAAGTGGSE